MKRRILVISQDERIGRWFRFMLSGRRTGLPTTVVTTLQAGIRALKRLHPRVVIFVEDRSRRADDRLMLLRALLLIEEESHENTLAILYDLVDGRLTMYHNIHVPRVSLDDIARSAAETPFCPLFGYTEEAVPGFPKDCRFLPLMYKGAVQAAAAAATPATGMDRV